MMPLSLHNQKMGDGAIFIYAGVIKLLEPASFAVLLDAYGIIPDPLILPVATVLPALEVAAGAGLLFDLRGSLSFITGLLVLFSVITSYGIWMGLDVECGCFGPQDPEADAFHGLKTTLLRGFDDAGCRAVPLRVASVLQHRTSQVKPYSRFISP
jgi:hypothetical protein